LSAANRFGWCGPTIARRGVRQRGDGGAWTLWRSHVRRRPDWSSGRSGNYLSDLGIYCRPPPVLSEAHSGVEIYLHHIEPCEPAAVKCARSLRARRYGWAGPSNREQWIELKLGARAVAIDPKARRSPARGREPPALRRAGSRHRRRTGPPWNCWQRSSARALFAHARRQAFSRKSLRTPFWIGERPRP